jgi:hypothetical protein
MATAHAREFRVIDGGKVADESTGEVYVGSSELLEVTQQLEEAEVALRKERTKVTTLKRQLAKMQLAEAEGVLITEVLTHWAVVTNHPKALIPLTGVRARAVRNMLKALMSVDDGLEPDAKKRAAVEKLKRVAEGAATFPFERYGDRHCCGGDGRKRRDDATFIYANEQRVELLAGLAGQKDEAHEAYRRLLAKRCRERPGLVRALALCAELGPHGEVLARAVVWAKGQQRNGTDGARAAVLRSRI